MYCADECFIRARGELRTNNPSFTAQVDNLSYRDAGSSIRVIKGDPTHAEVLRSAHNRWLEGLLAPARPH